MCQVGARNECAGRADLHRRSVEDLEHRRGTRDYILQYSWAPPEGGGATGSIDVFTAIFEPTGSIKHARKCTVFYG